MKGERTYQIVHKEALIRQNQEQIVVRVRAIIDNKKFNICRLEERKPVKIERQISGNKYELIAECDNIVKAGSIIDEYMNNFTYAINKYVRLKLI